MAIFSGKFYLTEKTSEYDFVPPEFHGGSTLGQIFVFQFVWALDSGMTNRQTNKQTNVQTNKPTLLFLPRLFDGKDPSANAAGNSSSSNLWHL